MTIKEPNKKRKANVAIVTRTKDRPLLLVRCLESVLNQDYSDWIQVVVNDGGNREVVDDVIERYEQRYSGRLTLLSNEVSVGMEAASNIGLRATESRFVVILDDDDTWDPKFLSKMVAALEQPEFPDVKGAACHIEIVYERVEGSSIIEERRANFNSRIDYAELVNLMAWNRFTPVCFMFERSALDTVGMFDESLPVCVDWEFNIRFLSKFEITVIKEKLAFYHQRRKSRDNYGNSVHADWDEHRKYRARLSNKWIREGLSKGTVGLGELFILSNIIDYNEQHRQLLERRERRRILSRLRNLFDDGRRWVRKTVFCAK